MSESVEERGIVRLLREDAMRKGYSALQREDLIQAADTITALRAALEEAQGCDMIQCPYEARLAKAEAERDEADRRAGAAERQLVQLKENEFKRNHWLDRAKEEAGYHRNVTFDTVWQETLEKARRADAAEQREARLREALEEVANYLDHAGKAFSMQTANTTARVVARAALNPEAPHE